MLADKSNGLAGSPARSTRSQGKPTALGCSNTPGAATRKEMPGTGWSGSFATSSPIKGADPV